MTAAERVAEFLRQWRMMRDKSDDIYGVHADVSANMAQLTATDLQAILDRLRELESLNHRLKDQLSVSTYAPWKLP